MEKKPGLEHILHDYVTTCSDHYRFFMHRTVPADWHSKLPLQAEERWLHIHALLSLDPGQTEWQEHICYFVKCEHIACYGHASTQSLVCVAPVDSQLERPFLHEETHVLTYKRWGMLPAFFMEGIAHYVERSAITYGHEMQQQQGKSAGFWASAFLEQRDHVLDILQRSDCFRQEMPTYPMYLLASNFIDFIITTCGPQFLHRCCTLIGSGTDITEAMQRSEPEIIAAWRQFAQEQGR
ncbi:MAG TPA: hypothetical protein VKY19_15440 [Ktedonosporobacter sp.]|jgi:hypothetical protein|nr:hypothetical protein [Ktedonosporobacter sp.]